MLETREAVWPRCLPHEWRRRRLTKLIREFSAADLREEGLWLFMPPGLFGVHGFLQYVQNTVSCVAWGGRKAAPVPAAMEVIQVWRCFLTTSTTGREALDDKRQPSALEWPVLADSHGNSIPTGKDTCVFFVLGPKLRIQYTYTYVKDSEHRRSWIWCTYLALFASIYLVKGTNTHAWKILVANELELNTDTYTLGLAKTYKMGLS